MDKKKKLMIGGGVIALLLVVVIYLNVDSPPPAQDFDKFSNVLNEEPVVNPPHLKPEEERPWLKERERMNATPAK